MASSQARNASDVRVEQAAVRVERVTIMSGCLCVGTQTDKGGGCWKQQPQREGRSVGTDRRRGVGPCAKRTSAKIERVEQGGSTMVVFHRCSPGACVLRAVVSGVYSAFLTFLLLLLGTILR